MIEKKQAIENLDAILDVEGVDMVQFGPSDYAMSIGATPSTAREAVREAETFMIESAQRKGVAVRAEVHDASQANRYLEMDIRHYCVGHDVLLLHEWYVAEGRRLRDLVEGKSPNPTNKSAPDTESDASPYLAPKA